MITNNKQDKNFLRKDLPRGVLKQEDVDSLWSNIGEYLESNISAANQLNDKYLSVLDATAKNSDSALNRLTSIASLLADLYSISGASNTSFGAFSSGIKAKVESVNANRDLLNVSLDKSVLHRSTPRAVKIHSRNGTVGNTREYDTVRFNDVENIVGSHSRVEIESFDSELVAAIQIDLGQVEVLNTLGFKVHNFGVRLPLIESIQTSEDGIKFTSQNVIVSNSQSVELEDFTFPEGNVQLDLTEFKARYIRINMVQRFPYALNTDSINRYAIGISALSASFNSAAKEGEVIFGPFKTSSEVLKAAVYADVQRMNLEERNVTFQISNDLQEWYELENSEVYDESSELSKVVNFNNVERSSIRTVEPVTQVYLKINMKSIDMTHLNQQKDNVTRYRSRLSSSNKSIFTGIAEGDKYVFKSEGFKYGARVGNPEGANVLNAESIVDFRIDGKTVVKSIGPSSSGIDVSKGFIRPDADVSLTVYNRFDKVHVVDGDLITAQPSYDFDPYALKMYRFSKPISSSMNIETVNNSHVVSGGLPVLNMSLPAGIYYLDFGTSTVSIDLSEGFAYSNSQTIYEVSDYITAAVLVNEIGEKISTIQAEENNGIRFISIFDSLGLTVPEVDGLVYSKEYPLRPLQNNEFAIEFGRLLFSQYFKGKAQSIPIVTKDISSTSPISGLGDSQRLLVNNSKQIKASYQLLDDDLKRTVKLKHTNIMNGTVGFDISEASVNAFVREVPFQDGATEFRLSSQYVQIDNYNLNNIQLQPGYVDDGEISFVGTISPFQNRVYSQEELIDEGDWMIDMDLIPTILLPDHVRTSDIIDTEISYNIEAGKISTSGLYSVDYKRGIMHTVAPIDHRTYINYKYSYMFSEYEALESISEDNYSDAGTSVSIDGEIENGVDYMVLVKAVSGSSFDYKSSPVISDLRLNLITADDFL